MLNSTMNDINPYLLTSSYLNKHNIGHPGHSYGKRTVKWYEIELILWGEGCILTGGKKLLTQKGNLFFRKPGMVVEGICPYFCYLVVFDMVYMKDKKDAYLEPNPMTADHKPDQEEKRRDSFELPEMMPVQDFNAFEVLFRNIYDEYISSGVENQFFLKTYLMQILLLAYKQHTACSLSDSTSRSIHSNYNKIMEIKKHIDEHPTLRFSLDTLSDMAELSPNFFCKIFRDIVGISPVSYVNKSKINRAKKLLIETNKSIKQISCECGFKNFENETYFYTLFKKHEGISPLAYRDRHRVRV